MRDAWYGHRDFYFEEYGDKDEWIDWDYAIASALQTIEDMTDSHGLLAWETESERMDVEAVKKIDKFQASIDRKTKGSEKNPYKPEPGEAWVPKTTLRGGEEPTYRSYLQRLRDGNGELAPEEDWGEAAFGKSWAELQAEEEEQQILQ